MLFVFKPQAPFERLKSANQCPEVALFKAIILQAIIDASCVSVFDKNAVSARDWLFGNSNDFKEVCIRADLEPCFVVRTSRRIVRLHQAKVKNERFSKKRKSYAQKMVAKFELFIA